MEHSSSSSSITISSTDIIRLILVHLTECGLYESCHILRKESGIGMISTLYEPKQFWYSHCVNGNWGILLDTLSLYDKEQLLTKTKYDGMKYDLNWVIANIHEITILELADANEWELAYATYRLVQNDLSEIMIDVDNDNNNSNNNTSDDDDDDDDDSDQEKDKKKKKKKKSRDKKKGMITATTQISMSRVLEQKLAKLADQRKKDPNCIVSKDFYSTGNNNNYTKQQRRHLIGTILEEIIPRQPKNRLISLLQQAMKWQMYTGQMPRIKRILKDDDDDDEEDNEESIDNDDDKKRKKAKKRRKKNNVIKEFDLVLGEINVDPVTVGADNDNDDALLYWMGNNTNNEKNKIIGIDKWSTIKFGKNATPESAIFLPDNTASLITGSSDGLIEIWDSSTKYTSLRTHDLIYQQKEELLGHDINNNKNNTSVAITALAITNDCQLLASGDNGGCVNIWRFDSGKCLRSISAHDHHDGTTSSGGTIMCLSFTPDGSRILTASYDTTCREFSLRTSRMLKEFRGHVAYVTTCAYKLINSDNNYNNYNIQQKKDDYFAVDNDSKYNSTPLMVITSSGDGSVRIWDGTTADILFVLRPISMGLTSGLTKAGESVVIADSHHAINAIESSSPAIHSVLLCHTPPNTMIIIPRGQRAFLVNFQGYVLKIFQDSGDKDGNAFVAATLSSSNRWLYIVKEDGCCCIFDVTNGELVRTIPDFGESSTSKSTTTTKDGTTIALKAAEISVLLHHPTKNIVGAFSNVKGQKKGQLVLWK